LQFLVGVTKASKAKKSLAKNIPIKVESFTRETRGPGRERKPSGKRGCGEKEIAFKKKKTPAEKVTRKREGATSERKKNDKQEDFWTKKTWLRGRSARVQRPWEGILKKRIRRKVQS